MPRNFTARFKLLCSKITPSSYAGHETVVASDKDTIDIDLISDCVRELIEDRLKFSAEFLSFAQNCQAIDADMEFRMAVGRAYYSVRHASRALLLFVRGKDEWDHRPAINEAAKIIGNEGTLRGDIW